MKPRALALAAIVAALAIPAAADARALAPKHPAKPATHVVKHKVTRVLCICITGPVVTPDPQTQAELEAAYDQDLIAHGLDPVYGTTTATGTAASLTDG